MSSYFKSAILLAIASLMSVLTYAQDSSSDDPYSDYSYLWENTKKKKKKEKKKKKATPVTVAKDTTSLDSLDVNAHQFLMSSDSIPNDSLRVETEPDPYLAPADSVIEESTDPYGGEMGSKTRWKDREIEPVDDFRAGMGSGGSNGSFNGGFTYTQIGDNSYVGLVLTPEFSIKKVGVGLNIPILYGLDDQKIRTEIFKGGVGVLRLVRYVRYGVQKKDPIYVKAGELSRTMIGFGSLVNNYTNTTSYEKRKVGVHFDFHIMQGLVGLEGLYSDVDPVSLNLLTIRPYTRPLIWTSIPIVRTLEMGATFIKDKDQTKRNGFTYNHTKDGIGAFGVDMGVVVLSIPFIQIDLFAGYSKLNISNISSPPPIDETDPVTPTTIMSKAGSGVSAGMNFRFRFIADVLSTDVRIERLNYTDNYLPQFFDALYELNKDAKIESLADAKAISGTYGSLTGHIMQTVRLGGSLLIPDNISEETPATVRVSADVDRLANKISMHASYIKGNLSDLGDAFSFDDRSLAKVRFIYHLNSFLATGVDYYYYWEERENGEYKATNYVMPYFGVSIQF